MPLSPSLPSDPVTPAGPGAPALPGCPASPGCPGGPMRPYIRIRFKRITYREIFLQNKLLHTLFPALPGGPGSPRSPGSPREPRLPGGPGRPEGPLPPFSPTQLQVTHTHSLFLAQLVFQLHATDSYVLGQIQIRRRSSYLMISSSMGITLNGRWC